MTFQILKDQNKSNEKANNSSQLNIQVFSKDYVDFLNESGWRLEKKFPSNNHNYSDLLEDTEWKCTSLEVSCLKHYRRDLDALS